MKKIYTFLLLFCSCYAVSFAQSADYSKMASGLIEQMENKSSELIPIFVELETQLDIEAFRKRFEAQRTSNANRAKQLIQALRSQQEATQPVVMDFIMAREEDYDESSLQSFWIANTICLNASPSLVAELSLRDDIVHIGFQGEFEAEHTEEVIANAPPVPNGIELGLSTINAPALWRMGYTGLGRRGYVIDSGVEPTVPALSTQYRGNSLNDNVAWRNINALRAQDCGEHGTHVAGTMVGLDRMTNDTIGVAFNASLMGAAIYSGCGGGFSYVISSFQWAFDPDGNPNTVDDMPDVINNSWRWTESNECNGTFRATFDALEAAGIAIVFSAGNSGPDPRSITSPHNINSSLVNVFAVGNLDARSAGLLINNSSSRGPSVCGNTNSLNIKPEVSAPGTQVRSCLPDGGYASWNGTSMAAPHAAGAILLLKEAFPFLSGEDIKLALYFTARDLGEPGEDNDYGMGIIDVGAAYDYLIDEGHTPVPPVIPANDIMVAGMDFPSILCNDEAIDGRMLLENSGSKTITSLEIEWFIDDLNNAAGSAPWSGNLETGQRAWFDIPIDDLTPGAHIVMVRAKNPNGETEDHIFNNGQRRRIEILAPNTLNIEVIANEEAQPCRDNPVLLYSDYDGEGLIRWYDRFGINLLGEGPYFLTPPISSPQTYRLEVLETPSVGAKELGEINDVDSEEAGIEFDSFQEFKLESVKVFSESRGTRTIKLLNRNGDQLASRTLLLRNTGENVLELNFNVPVGNGLRLVLDSNRELLYHRGPDVDFPYEVDRAITLTNSIRSNGAASSSRYYYFYDWKLEFDYLCGEKTVDVVPLDIATTLSAAFEFVNDVVEIRVGDSLEVVDASTDATDWYWAFGDGEVSIVQNPTHVYRDSGIYLVSLTVENADGCSDVEVRTIRVLPALATSIKVVDDFDDQIEVFPNPISSRVMVRMSFEEPHRLRMVLTDVLGRPLWQTFEQRLQTHQEFVNTSKLSEGVYCLNFYIDGAYLVSRKLVKVK
ncbi:MAG: S8 family serine peptidase [Bacteroidota bacterium]